LGYLVGKEGTIEARGTTPGRKIDALTLHVVREFDFVSVGFHVCLRAERLLRCVIAQDAIDHG
jgi:hypothetical protein